MKIRECKIGIVFGIIILFIGVSIIPSIMSIETQKITTVTKIQTTWIVDDEDDGNFTSIQEAIASTDVEPGDTIVVYSGTYVENVVVYKQLTLIGNDTELENGNDTGKPRIDGEGKGDVIKLTVDDCLIDSFDVTNSILSYLGHGINVLSKNNILRNNNISNSDSGIYIDHDSSNNTIFNNFIFSNLHDGIEPFGSNNNILGNVIKENQAAGICLDGSSNNIISDNFISKSNWAGINLYGESSNNEIFHNQITNCENWGIRIALSSYNNISCNNIDLNQNFNIFLQESKNNIISVNNISNSMAGLYLENSLKNKIKQNNFKNNWFSHATFQNSFWNSWSRNYWDDWKVPVPRPVWGFLFSKPISIPCLNVDWSPATTEWDIC